jgi:predicted SAM-dependent methyltransferase
VSETSKCRDRLQKYCVGYGVDLGFGGDPIVPTAITVDRPSPYAKVGSSPLNLGGDARNLYWFASNSLNYVFSSHLLEDFPPNETRSIVLEWLRVLATDGYLILYLPDEQKYRQQCKASGQPYNQNHQIENFSLNYLKNILSSIPEIEIVHENAACEEYSFEIVVRKILQTDTDGGTEKDNRIRELEQRIQSMKNSKGWKLLEKIRIVRNKLFSFFRIPEF